VIKRLQNWSTMINTELVHDKQQECWCRTSLSGTPSSVDDDIGSGQLTGSVGAQEDHHLSNLHTYPCYGYVTGIM